MTFPEKFKARTKSIGLAIIKMVQELPNIPVVWVLSKQILRSSTSVGANYRAACRAKSTADFLNKLKIVEEEADETIYWLEMLYDAGLVAESKVKPLLKETSEILSMVVTAIKTTRDRT